MNDIIIDSVHRIANSIYKKKGYFVSINKSEVSAVLEAFSLLTSKIRESNIEENKDKG